MKKKVEKLMENGKPFLQIDLDKISIDKLGRVKVTDQTFAQQIKQFKSKRAMSVAGDESYLHDSTCSPSVGGDRCGGTSNIGHGRPQPDNMCACVAGCGCTDTMCNCA